MPEGQPSIAALTIRRAVADDAPAIVSLLYESFVEYRSFYTAGGFAATVISQAEVIERMHEGPLFVAEMNGTVVGTVAIVPKNESLYIRGMAVHPSARGQRIGDQLLAYVEDLAISQGARRLLLSTTPFLERAIRLYQSFGFERTDEGPHELHGTPLFAMEKLLPLNS
jgi:N-acetylglutamate synthase-like GNAT family acetyltransferase